MAGKPGFMMYHAKARALARMGPESFMAVMLAMCDYSEFGAEPTALNDMEEIAFYMMREALDRDDEKYQRRVEAGRKGGIASGEARRTIANQNERPLSKRTTVKQTNDCEANEPTQHQPNINPTSTQPNINPTSGDSSNPYAREGDGEEEFPPTVEMVEEVIRAKGLNVDAREFLARCEANGWKDGAGRPVINWRTWLTGYALRSIRPDEGGAARLRADPRLAALEAMKGGCM